MKLYLNNGYMRFRIPGNNGKQMYLHTLIAESFIGKIPKGFSVNHKNGNKIDNRLENLEVISLRDNTLHQHKNGFLQKGETNGHALLTNKKVRYIKTQLLKGVKGAYLARKFNVAESTICDINKKRTWGWL